MDRSEKVRLLKSVLQGKDLKQALNDEPMGPVLIKMGENDYYSSSLDKSLTREQVEQKLTQQAKAGSTAVTFILPHNNR